MNGHDTGFSVESNESCDLVQEGFDNEKTGGCLVCRPTQRLPRVSFPSALGISNFQLSSLLVTSAFGITICKATFPCALPRLVATA